MKPLPPDTLLAKGQEWIVVEAPWGILDATEEYTCSFYHCDRRSIIYNPDPVRIFTESFCPDHMGSHRWIQAGKVVQWRANPPFDNAAHKVKVAQQTKRRGTWTHGRP